MKKEVVDIIGMYFYATNFDTMSVTRIEVEENENDLNIHITTRRPGLLIGRHGRYIEQLSDHVSDKLERKVNFKIIEDTLWSRIPIHGDNVL
jgi:ribosomal protein S3